MLIFSNLKNNKGKFLIFVLFLFCFLLFSAGSEVEAKVINVGTATDSIFINGSLGIGTSTPDQKLSLSVGNVDGIKITSSNAPVLRLYSSAASADSRNWQFTSNWSATGDFQFLRTTTNTGDPGTVVWSVNKDGNMGIGTTTPDAKLSINGSATFNTGAGLSIGNVGSYNKLITYSAGPVFRIFTGGGYSSFGAGSASIGSSYAATSSPVSGLIVEGNVGIGLTNPSSTLDILGNFRNSSATTHSLLGGSGNVVVMADNTGTLYNTPLATFNSTNSLWGGTKNGNIYNGDAGAGNVGIGTTNPTVKLQILAAASTTPVLLSFPNGNTVSNYTGIIFSGESPKAGILFASNGAGYARGNLIFATSNSMDYSGINLSNERMRITDGGLVGIGVTPNAMLHVRSSVAGTGGLVVDGVANLPFKVSTYGNESGNVGAFTVLGASNSPRLNLYDTSSVSKVQISGTLDSYFNGGNVGVGTTTPTSRLAVFGNYSAGNNLVSLVNNAGGGGGRSLYVSNFSGNSDPMTYFDNKGVGATAVFMGGSVGIGTTNPGGKLHVSTTGDTNSLIINNTSGNVLIGTATDVTAYGGAKLQVKGGASGVSTWSGRIIAGGSTSVFLMGEIDSRAVLAGHNTALSAWNDLYINPVNNANTYIGNSGSWPTVKGNSTLSVVAGNVGIGLTNPSSTLDILGNFRNSSAATHSLLGGSGNVVVMADNTGTLYTGTVASSLLWSGSTSGNIWSANTGNVGIGTSSPVAKLHIAGTDNKIRLSYDTTNYIDMTANSTGQLRIAPTSGATYLYGSGVKNFLFTYDFSNSRSNYSTLTSDSLTLQNITNTTTVSINAGASSYFNGGNVGIGTTSPLDLLVVSKTVGANTGEIRFGSGNGRTLSAYNNGSLANFDFYAVSTYFNSNFILASQKQIQMYNYANNNSNYSTIYIPSNENLTFRVNGLDRMSIDSAGKVGIGSTTPNTQLSFASASDNVIDVAGGKIKGLVGLPTADDHAVPLGYLKSAYSPKYSELTLNHTSVGDNYTALETDSIIAYTSLPSTKTLTVPDAACTQAGKFFIVVDESGQASASKKIIINPAGDIIGRDTFELQSAYNSVYIFCNKVGSTVTWFIL